MVRNKGGKEIKMGVIYINGKPLKVEPEETIFEAMAKDPKWVKEELFIIIKKRSANEVRNYWP